MPSETVVTGERSQGEYDLRRELLKLSGKIVVLDEASSRYGTMTLGPTSPVERRERFYIDPAGDYRLQRGQVTASGFVVLDEAHSSEAVARLFREREARDDLDPVAEIERAIDGLDLATLDTAAVNPDHYRALVDPKRPRNRGERRKATRAARRRQ